MKESSGFWKVPAPGGRELRNYGLLMAAVGSLVAAALWYKGNETATWWAVGVALAFLGTGVVCRPALRPLYHVWMLLVVILGYVNTHILLAIIFYTMFTVTGLIMRVLRRDPLELKGFGRREADSSDRKDSYWAHREQPLLPADHPEHQF